MERPTSLNPLTNELPTHEEVQDAPVGYIFPGISCQGCRALCCRKGIVMPLTDDEAANLRDAGTGLERFPKKQAIWRRFWRLAQNLLGNTEQRYRLTTDCGHLTEDGKCAIYGGPRPRICSDFMAGSVACVSIQRARANSRPSARNSDK